MKEKCSYRYYMYYDKIAQPYLSEVRLGLLYASASEIKLYHHHHFSNPTCNPNPERSLLKPVFKSLPHAVWYETEFRGLSTVARASNFCSNKYRGSLPYATFGSGKNIRISQKIALGKYFANAIFDQFYFISAIWLMRFLAFLNPK